MEEVYQQGTPLLNWTLLLPGLAITLLGVMDFVQSTFTAVEDELKIVFIVLRNGVAANVNEVPAHALPGMTMVAYHSPHFLDKSESVKDKLSRSKFFSTPCFFFFFFFFLFFFFFFFFFLKKILS